MELPANTLVATGLCALPVLAMALDPRTLLASYTSARTKLLARLSNRKRAALSRFLPLT